MCPALPPLWVAHITLTPMADPVAEKYDPQRTHGIQRRVLVYSGHVQGVGFRATAAAIAIGHRGVTGFVRNQADGTVHLEAQGSGVSLDAFLEEVAASMHSRIARVDVTSHALVAGEAGFRVER